MTASPDWRALDDYAQVMLLAVEMRDQPLGAFLSGPLSRLLELASDSAQGPRERERIVECARSLWLDRCEAKEAQAQADAFVAQRLAGAPDEAYLLDVWDGLATHNYTAPIPRAQRT